MQTATRVDTSQRRPEIEMRSGRTTSVFIGTSDSIIMPPAETFTTAAPTTETGPPVRGMGMRGLRLRSAGSSPGSRRPVSGGSEGCPLTMDPTIRSIPSRPQFSARGILDSSLEKPREKNR